MSGEESRVRQYCKLLRVGGRLCAKIQVPENCLCSTQSAPQTEGLWLKSSRLPLIQQCILQDRGCPEEGPLVKSPSVGAVAQH